MGTSDNPATSFVDVPCDTPTLRRNETTITVGKVYGTLYLRDNATGSFTLVQPCRYCGKVHPLSNVRVS